MSQPKVPGVYVEVVMTGLDGFLWHVPVYGPRRVAKALVRSYGGNLPTDCRVFFSRDSIRVYELLDNKGRVSEWKA